MYVRSRDISAGALAMLACIASSHGAACACKVRTYVRPSIGCSEAKARAQAIFGRLASLGKHSLTALQQALRYNNSKHLRRAPPLQ